MRSTSMVLAAGLAASSAAMAATINVNHFADEFGENAAQCTLREAVQAANADAAFGGCSAGSGSDLILLPSGIGVILARAGRDEDANATGDLDITGTLEIRTALANNRAAISGSGLDRVFDVRPAALLQISRITLANGDPTVFPNPRGGGLLRLASAGLIGSELEFRDGFADAGGAIAQSGGTLSLNQSLFHRNRSSGKGGAIEVSAAADLALRSSTLSENAAGSSGGAIALTGADVVLLNNVTIADNVAATLTNGAAGGLYVESAAAVGAHNSVIAGNSARGGVNANCFGELDAVAYSLVEGASTSVGAACHIGTATALVTGPALLLPLADYGGPTLSMHPSLDSPLRNAGNTGAGVNCHSLDQRGETRTGACDVGAIEFSQVFTVNTSSDTPDANIGDGNCVAIVSGLCTLRAAVQEANALSGRQTVLAPGLYTITNTGSGDDTGATGDIDISDELNLFGSVAGASRIDGNAQDRLLDIRADAAVAHLRLQNGAPGAANGGAVQVSGGLGNVATLIGLRLNANMAVHGGGIAVDNARAELFASLADGNLISGRGGGAYLTGAGASLSLIDSALTDNRADGDGGGAHVSGGTLDLQYATIARNRSVNGVGGGLHAAAGNVPTVNRSIVADNTRGASPLSDDCNGSFSGDRNLVGNDSACLGMGANSQLNVPAGLTPTLVGGGVHGVAMPGLAVGSLAHGAELGECPRVDGRELLQDGLGRPRPTLINSERRCSTGAVQESDRLFADGFD
ncbi:MAG: CSLREA domain-containing protein [Xanthomonadales bacterium]|nr:CSLREA domain-containing protein [Xanthomonadales bacterium]